MSASEGLRIISVAKSLEPYQRDPNLARYFGATQLAGRAGNFLSSLRNQQRVSWDKFIAHAANACLDGPTVKAHILPWLKSNGFVDVGAGEKPASLIDAAPDRQRLVETRHQDRQFAGAGRHRLDCIHAEMIAEPR